MKVFAALLLKDVAFSYSLAEMKTCSYSSCLFDWPNFSNIPISVTLQIYLLTLAVLSESD